MAMGLEVVATSMTVARTSCTHAPSAYTSVLSGKSSKRNNLCLPTCTGLKIGVHAKGFTVSSDEKRRRGFKRVVCEAQETVAQVQNVSGSTWQSLVLESDVPVLVDFWAPWCGPCKIIDPLIDELAKQYAGKLRCFKLNTDESPHIATAYGIRSIPTVMLFKNGEKKDTVIGAVPKTTLTASIEKYVEW